MNTLGCFELRKPGWPLGEVSHKSCRNLVQSSCWCNHLTSWGISLSFQARGFLLSVGYSLAVGAMFSKLWRVYQIYSNFRPKEKVNFDNLYTIPKLRPKKITWPITKNVRNTMDQWQFRETAGDRRKGRENVRSQDEIAIVFTSDWFNGPGAQDSEK